MASSSSSPPLLTAIDGRRSMDPRKKLKKLKSRKYPGMRLIKPSSRRVKTVLDSPSSSSYQSNSNSDSTSVNQSPFEFPAASPDFMTVISQEGRDEIDEEEESGVIKESASSRNYLKATSSSDGKKTRSQARIRNSSNDVDIETKSQTTSSRNFGFLMSKSSFKYRKPVTTKNVNRNTCSSTLKDCKFPCTIELQTGERESLITPIMKVCPYTYCSLHGHQHKPPLPRFRRALSKNRRAIRSQRSMKFRGQSSLRREQCIDDLLKEIDTIDGDPIVKEIATEGSDFSEREDHGPEVETEEQTDLQADDSSVIEEEDDADKISEPIPSEFLYTEMHNAPLHNLENASKTRELEEQTDLQADDSSAIVDEDDADMISEPNPKSEFLSMEMHNAPLHNLKKATKTRELEEQTDLQDDDSSAIVEEDDADTIVEPNPKSEFLSMEMHNAPLHNLENATKTRELEEQTDLQADDSSAIDEEDDVDTIAEPNPKSEFLSTEMHNAPLHNLEHPTKTREHEEQTDLQADDSSAIEEEDDTDTITEPSPNSEFLYTEMYNAPLHNLENASKTREHEEQADIQADDSRAMEEEDDSDTIAEPNSKSEFLSTEMHNAPLHNLEIATKTREHGEQADLQTDDSSAIEEEDDTDTVAEPTPNSEFLSTEMYNAPLHNLENASKTREHEEQTDLQADDSREIEEEDDADTIAELNSKSEFLSTEMHNAPLHNLKIVTKTREHEEQADLQTDDSSAIEEEDDTNTVAEPTPNSELLSTEMYNAPHHNLENTFKTRQHEDSIEIPCSSNSTDGILKQDCEVNQFCPDKDSEQNGKIEVSNTPLSRRNHVSMWRLINQHMVLGLPPSDENTKTESNQTEDREIEVRKIHAVKLVREAIENILLPEVQDDQSSVCSDITTDQEELLEENSTLATAAKGNKSEKKAIKNWSNLKKWVLLKRFIKELEKVKRLNLSRQQSLPLETESDGEKVNLRHQTTDVKKKTEEWMLDYALRKVVSELAPTQQKKVALLVKAFETVGPTPEEALQISSLSFRYNGERNLNVESAGQQNHHDETSIISTEPTILDKIKIYKSLSDGSKLRTDDSCIASIASSPRSTTTTSLDHERELEKKDGKIMQGPGESPLKDVVQAERQSPDSSTLGEVFNRKLNGTKGLGMWHLIHQNMQPGESPPDDVQAESQTPDSSTLQEVFDRKLNETKGLGMWHLIHQNMQPGESPPDDVQAESQTPDSSTLREVFDRKLNETKGLGMWHLIHQNMQPGESPPTDVQAESQTPDSSTLREVFDRKLNETKGLGMRHLIHQNMQPGESPPDDVQAENQSLDSSTLREVFDRKLNETKGLGMWHLIHQNMVQGLHHKKGSSIPEEEDNEDVSRPSSDSSPAGTESDDYSEERLEIEERKINTIKLVREAIENILLPAEFQDTEEKKHTEETTESVLKDNTEEKSGKQALKSWSSLKKMILLKRFIKELANVKKTIKRGTDDEEGVPHLRRQLKTSDKRNSEEWMLDFALRQVVSELAPVQKKKVALLVKAFETVAPPSDQELNLQIASSPIQNNKPIDTGHEPVSFKLIPEQSVVSQIDNPHQEQQQQQLAEKKKSQKSDLDLKSKLANEKPMDKRQYISMWHQLCQHVVSSAEEKVEKDDAADTNKIELEFKQSDAVRLVKEAIGEIMSQETKDDMPDSQSTCSDDDGFDKQMAQAMKMSKSEGGEGLRKWSKVRKLIILKRSIKAMENARKKYSQRPPQFLALKAEIGEEKIDLRQQMIDERKKAEDWMLDNALQNIVNKLNPARKRRVSMLVEAFEAVVPLPSF